VKKPVSKFAFRVHNLQRYAAGSMALALSLSAYNYAQAPPTMYMVGDPVHQVAISFIRSLKKRW
jgi:hypothetical protein